MSGDATWDVIVIGMGIMGSSTAYFLSKYHGKRVLCLEQFDLGHSRGSSHGHTRILRKVYNEDHFTKIAMLSYPLWESVQAECGFRLYQNTGGLDWDSSTSGISEKITERAKTLRRLGVACEEISGLEASRRFPGLYLPEGSNVLYQPDSGVSFANKSVRAFQSLAVSAGATILENSPVSSIKSGKDSITVTTENGKTFVTKKLVITPGGWLKPFLQKHFNITVHADVWKVGYWYWNSNGSNAYEASNGFPVFIDHSPVGFYYGTPALEYPNLIKIGAHYPSTLDVTASTRTFVPDPVLEAGTKEWVRKHFKLCDADKPALAETCLYTVTRNEEFLMDRLPSNPNIVVGGGFSGHGFKHSPMVGKMLASLVLSDAPAAEAMAAAGQHASSPSLNLCPEDLKDFTFAFHTQFKARL